MCKLTAEQLSSGPCLKLQRAEHHINDLNGRIEAFLAERPFKLMIHHRRQANQTALRTKTEKSIPPEFSVIIGDAVHNLRSALDLALFPMAKDRSPKPSRIQFPFPKDRSPKAYETAFESGQVEFAGKKVAEAICKLKPDPTRNPILNGVHALSNRDKHQLLILTRTIPEFLSGTGSDELLKKFLGLSKHPVAGVKFVLAAPDDEDLLAIPFRYATVGLGNTEIESNAQPTFAISFSEATFAKREVVQALLDCTKEVRCAVDALIAAYLDPGNTFPS